MTETTPHRDLLRGGGHASSADHLNLTPLGAVRHALTSCGFVTTVTPTGDGAGPLLTAANPCQPWRGNIIMTGDGELQWNTRAPHHPDGGIPLPDIANAIIRALTRAEHPAISDQQEEPA